MEPRRRVAAQRLIADKAERPDRAIHDDAAHAPLSLVSAAVAVTVVLVTIAVAASALMPSRRSSAALTAALVAQFRREFTSEADQVAARASNVSRRVTPCSAPPATSRGRARAPTAAPYVDPEASSIAAAQGWDVLDLVAEDGTIVSSAQWPARFGYRHPWATASANAGRGAFLPGAIEPPHETALGLVAVRKAATRDGDALVAGRPAARRVVSAVDSSCRPARAQRCSTEERREPEVSRQQPIDASGQVAHRLRRSPGRWTRARAAERPGEATDTIRVARRRRARRRDSALAGAATAPCSVCLLIGAAPGRELAALVIDASAGAGAAFGALRSRDRLRSQPCAVAARVTRPVRAAGRDEPQRRERRLGPSGSATFSNT